MNRVTTDRAENNRGLHTAGWIATVLVVIGALNWLLVGLFDVDIVATVFGRMSTLSRIVYTLIGIAGLYEIYFARLLARESHRGLGGAPVARAT
ncbi:MAG: hypothetical protein JWP87_5443 [Labilithrix sp.]|nr:hypothetical protein [Labilithrix sp.]